MKNKYPITKCLGDEDINITTDREMAEYEARCAERDRSNSAKAPLRIKVIINLKK